MTTGLGPTDFVALFSTIFGDVVSTRAARQLKPLVSFHLGQEWIRSEEDAPRIVVVPDANVYDPARKMGRDPMTGALADFNPQVFFYGGWDSKRTSGETRRPRQAPLRSKQMIGTRSVPRWSSSANSWARSCEMPATFRRFAFTAPSGSSPQTCNVVGACSFYRSPSKRRSLTSRGLSSHRLQRPWTRSSCSPMALRATREPSYFLHEVN